jgi:ATP-dependent exoDNAse (exonuclease V) beta subunit
LLLAPIKAAGSDSDATYKYLDRLDTEAEDVEASRLLYVAATRAEDRLHLLACLGCDKDGNIKRPTSHTLLSRAWPAAEPFFQTKHQVDPHAAPAPEVNTINRLPSGFQLPSMSNQVQWSAPPEGRDEEEIEFSWAGETARHVGTVVHRYLQRIAEDELKGWDARRIDALTGTFRRELQRRGVRASESYPAAELVRMALKNTLADERGRWTLEPHPEAHTEYRVRVHTTEGTRTDVLDRFFRTSSGEQWAVDYKTSRHEGSNVNSFLDQEVIRYTKQLERYRSVATNTRLGLYFPLLRGWRDWH